VKTSLVNEPWLKSDASRKIMSMLTDAGHGAWFVGGCVRNALISEPVADLDVTTSARPEIVTNLAKSAGLKVIPTGIEHGTVTVIAGGVPFEITTLRRDIATDGRRATIAFSDTIEEDAARRDFTMNALYADAEGVIFDPVGGLSDLQARRLRFIGEAADRIREDYLRSLRFFRFYAWYGDVNEGFDADALAAIAENLDGLDDLSKERIGAEMLKLLAAPDPAPALCAMQHTGALSRVIPGAEPGLLAVLVHLENGCASDAIRRLAVIGGEDVAKKLRLSKVNARDLAVLRQEMATDTSIAELGYRKGYECAANVALLRGVLTGIPLPDGIFEDAMEASKAVFPVSAKDLMPDYSGKELGDLLKKLEVRWIASDFTASRESLLAAR